jgi:feruloyl esterase
MGSPSATTKFARLFLVPGVDHGFRGPGSPPVDQFEALMRWVEEGVAPDSIRAEKKDADDKVIQSRRLLPYSAAAKHE